jgi:MFS transporter, ACS family, pantothenate transporter
VHVPTGRRLRLVSPTDYPHNSEAWYITEEDRQLALRRSANAGKADITGKMDMALVKRMLGNWRWWTLCLMYIFYGNSCQANQYFYTYLKAAACSVTLRNIIPACANLVSMVTEFFDGVMSDLYRNRAYWMVGPLVSKMET